ncbi:uncharacterized protein LOC111246326 isoform X1 [Varroa destructor]|uniref:Uncharacterized protein n=1 Tax=Varroa destructor TaxID=109461 RepID=A0A7M7JFT8_VARDE|nr:uncharacterized protein LOC111246326 isoform X1 [Varroa destructor]
MATEKHIAYFKGFRQSAAVVFVSSALFEGSVLAQDRPEVQPRVQSTSQPRAELYGGTTNSPSAGRSTATYGPPRPYEYSYQLDDTNGSYGHTEKRDEGGRVEGEYSINLGDGRVRVVRYVADENGYRADVSTDELGTESKNPNDVYIGSTAISGNDAALKYGPFAPPHVEEPVLIPERPQIRTIGSQVALPTYGTFAGAQNREPTRV